MSSNINIVLVNTSHPGNIGSTARAMKTMGLNNLTLVSPKEFPSDIANAKAVGCIDILENANVVKNYDDSLSRSSLVIGFSARSRKSNIPSLAMDELISMLNNHTGDEISIVFGNEQSGLSNEELQRCNYIVSIPTDDAYTSLNLASAVQIFSYEYFKSMDMKSKKKTATNFDFASHSTKKHITQTFLNIMIELDILNDKNRKSLTKNIHIIFNKIIFTNNEANLFLGVLNSALKALKK